MSRYARPSMRYVDDIEGYRRRRIWLRLVSGVVITLIGLWLIEPAIVLAIIGLGVTGGVIATCVKIHEFSVQQRANEAARAVDARLERDRWVTSVEHETEVCPLGADPTHCDDCRRVSYEREQRSIHKLAVLLQEKCDCGTCRGYVRRDACHHPDERVDDAYDVVNLDGEHVHVKRYCHACGYTLLDEDV
jgi:hypothetical protein